MDAHAPRTRHSSTRGTAHDEGYPLHYDLFHRSVTPHRCDSDRFIRHRPSASIVLDNAKLLGDHICHSICHRIFSMLP